MCTTWRSRGTFPARSDRDLHPSAAWAPHGSTTVRRVGWEHGLAHVDAATTTGAPTTGENSGTVACVREAIPGFRARGSLPTCTSSWTLRTRRVARRYHDGVTRTMRGASRCSCTARWNTRRSAAGADMAQDPRHACSRSRPFAHNLRAGSGENIDNVALAIYVDLSRRRGRSGRPSTLPNVEHSSTTSPQGPVHEESLVKSQFISAADLEAASAVLRSL